MRRRPAPLLALLALLAPLARFGPATLLVAACNAAGGPAPGTERGACGTGCADGLECWSDRCVRPPGADCRAVGERLASHQLGNYATREERAPVVGDWAARCEAARLSRKEGACIVAAATEDDLAQCPRPLVKELEGDPRGCARIAARARDMIADAGGQLAPIRKVIDDVPAAVTQLCVDGRWSPDAKRCLMAAQDYGDAQACVAMMDGADRRAIERKLTSMVKRGMARPGPTPADDDPWR